MSAATSLSNGRVGWVDFAKGFCIIFVVMMHSTLGVEAAAGQQGWIARARAIRKPFRMPDFFMISGLFLALVIDGPGCAISTARSCTSYISTCCG